MDIPTLNGMPLDSLDQEAIASYERVCHESGEQPTDEGRLTWVLAWRGFEADDPSADVDDEAGRRA